MTSRRWVKAVLVDVAWQSLTCSWCAVAQQMRLEVWQRRHANSRVIAESKLLAGASWGGDKRSAVADHWSDADTGLWDDVGSGGGADRSVSDASHAGRVSPITTNTNGDGSTAARREGSSASSVASDDKAGDGSNDDTPAFGEGDIDDRV